MDNIGFTRLEDVSAIKDKYKSLSDIKIISFNFEKNIFGNDKISYKELFIRYLGDDIWSYYFDKVTEALNKAKQRLGYDTIRILTTDYLFDFKQQLIEKIKVFDLYKESYVNAQNRCVQLSHDDLKEVIGELNSKNLYYALTDENDFAKCFITSEYLYNNIRNEKCFDFTSVVCGYFKSFELLLLKIVKKPEETSFKRFDVFSSEKWNKAKNKEKFSNAKVSKDVYSDKMLITTIINSNEHPELCSLIDSIYYDDKYWMPSISIDGRKTMHTILRDYKSHCRNNFFHSDILYSKAHVEIIRKNTWICLLYLLGGVNNGFENYNFFESTYTEIYKELAEMPRSIHNFLITFDGITYKVVRPFLREEPVYHDQTGEIKSEIKFIKVNNFENSSDVAEKGLLKEQDLITISPSKIPDSIEWVNKSKSGIVFQKKNN